MFDTGLFRNIKTPQDFVREEQEFEARKRMQEMQQQKFEMQRQQAEIEMRRNQAQEQFARTIGVPGQDQDIEAILAQQAQATGDPTSYLDYMQKKSLIDQRARTEGGSVSAYMRDAQKLMEFDKSINPMQAYALARGGVGQGTYYNPQTGAVDVLPGFADSRGLIKEGESAGSARGKPLGEAQAEFADLAAAYPGLRDATNELAKLAQVATYTKAGRFTDQVKRQLGVDVGDSAQAAAKMKTIIDTEVLPLLKPTFGAQFTVNEGEWLRATMGDENLSPEEKVAQINARVQSWNRRLQTLERRTGAEIPQDVNQMMDMPVQVMPEAQSSLSQQEIDESIFNAKKAIKNGADPNFVRKRLQGAGIDPARAGL